MPEISNHIRMDAAVPERPAQNKPGCKGNMRLFGKGLLWHVLQPHAVSVPQALEGERGISWEFERAESECLELCGSA